MSQIEENADTNQDVEASHPTTGNGENGHDQVDEQPHQSTQNHQSSDQEFEDDDEYEYEEYSLVSGMMDNLKAKLREPELGQGAKLGGEMLILPGASLLVEGKYKPGLLHAGAGLLAGATLGLPGLALVAANSFSLSRTGRGLIPNLMGTKTKDVNLREEVARDVAAGLSLEEISARVNEDVADLYAEVKAEQTQTQEG